MKYFDISIFSIVLFASITLSIGSVFGQAVSINSTGAAPHANAILDVSTTGTQGVLLARMTTATRIGWIPTTSGVTVYDTDTESYWYWDDTANAWREIPNTSGIVTTLDGAYDGGGSGLGRTITGDAGSVQITGTSGAVALETDGDIQLATDQWIGIGLAGPRIEFENASGRLNMQNADVELDDGAWIGVGSTIERIEFDGANGEINVLGAELGVNTTAPTEQLDVNGQIRMRTGASNGFVPVGNATGVMTWTDPTTLGLDVTTASNGLTEVANDIQLGGSLTQATTIALGSNNLSFNASGTGVFEITDGTEVLMDVADAGTGTNDGRIQIYRNNAVQHTIHGDGNTVFNDQGANRDFIIESVGSSSMFVVDADANALGVGTNAPDVHSVADIRSTTKGILFPRMTEAQRDAIGQGTNTDYGLWIYNEDTDHYNYWDGNSWEEVVPAADLDSDDDWYQTTSTNTPTAIGDWIYTNGNVGINVGSTVGTLPLAALHAQSNAYIGDYNTGGFFNSNATLHIAKTANPHILLEDIGTNTGGLSFDGNGLHVATENGNIDFKTGVIFNGSFSGTGSARMTILNNGNIGIGTTTPDTKLHVDQQTNGLSVPLVVRNSAANTNGDIVGIGLVNEQVEYGNFYKAAMVHERTSGFGVGKLHFLVDDAADANSATLTESRMTILPNGNVGIGSTAPGAKLYVNGDATISGKFNSNGIQESSDKRFKKNINNLNGALENVMKIQGVTYDWRTEEFPERNFASRTEIGVIAQDLEEIYPELVSTDAAGYKSVQYSHIVPVLIEAIKEQQNMISGLTSTVENLSASLEAQHSKMRDLHTQVSNMEFEIQQSVIKSEVTDE
jgi:hypothetical protein